MQITGDLNDEHFIMSMISRHDGVSTATNLKLPGIRKVKHYTSNVLKLQS